MDRSHMDTISRGTRRNWRSMTMVALVVVTILCLHIFTSSLYSTSSASDAYTSHHHRKGMAPGDRVLVTGASGFIGFHLINELVRLGVTEIVGLDSYSTYYPPPYKYQRSWRLNLEHGIEIINGDVCDEELLTELLSKHNFTHIVHLAASANVRFSVEEPHTVLRNNVVCFQVILEQLRRITESGLPLPQFVWASSSSVYGLNEKVPFETTDRVDRPASLYGASKRMNEFQAQVYNHIFKIPSVGLRFFTVYGPWGRPDMAPFKFTKNIVNGEQITVFNEGKMKRDFTYVTDIVKGIVASMEFRSTEFRAFNLGNNQPVALHYFISTIEALVGKKAQKVYKESNVDLPLTYSSNEITKRDLKWQPTISIEEGMRKFVVWYQNSSIASLPCAAECSASRDCYPSLYDVAKVKSREITRSCSTVIYTILGVQDIPDSLNSVPKLTLSDSKICLVAFNGKNSAVTGDLKDWLVVEMDKFDESLSPSIRYLPKYNPQGFFADGVSFAIYVDPKHPVKLDDTVMETMQCRGTGGKSAGIGLFSYRNPKSLSQIASKSESKFIGVSQSTAYKTFSENRHRSLHQEIVASSGVVFHNMKDNAIKELRCRWINENVIWDDGSDEEASLNFVLQSSVTKISSEMGQCHHLGSNTCLKLL